MSNGATRLVVLSCLLAAALGCGAEVEPAPADDELSFAADVLPVLARSCTSCHSTINLGDLRTAESAWAVLTGPMRTLPTGFGCDGVPVTRAMLVVPGDADASALWQLVGVGFDNSGACPGPLGMPKSDPRGILADFDPDGAELIRRWIELGARDD